MSKTSLSIQILKCSQPGRVILPSSGDFAEGFYYTIRNESHDPIIIGESLEHSQETEYQDQRTIIVNRKKKEISEDEHD